MRTRLGWQTALVVIALSSACGPRRELPTRRLDRAVITREEMLNGKYATVYDAVAAMRSAWLRARGPDSFVLPSIVWVYVDGARLGGVEELRTIQPRLINTVRFYDGPSATSRWGVDNGAGVIHVSTWSEGAPGIPVPDSTRRKPKPDPE
jgi:hypothetical protein